MEVRAYDAPTTATRSAKHPARRDGQAAPAQRATFEFKNNKRSFECFPAAYLYLEANGAAGWAFPVP